MSINAMVNAATARRADFAPVGTVPKGLIGIATAAALPVALAAPVAIPRRRKHLTAGKGAATDTA